MSKKVLITGTLGQDGANMAEYLLETTDHEIYGMVRRSGSPNYHNIEDFKDNERFHLVDGDLTDSASIDNLVKKIEPNYLINFGANSFVGVSWEMPLQVFEANTLGVIRCLEAIKKFKPDCRFYSAGSSEEFGDVITLLKISSTRLNLGVLTEHQRRQLDIWLKFIKSLIIFLLFILFYLTTKGRGEAKNL